jgi:Flp pilus assembly pilin Flp
VQLLHQGRWPAGIYRHITHLRFSNENREVVATCIFSRTHGELASKMNNLLVKLYVAAQYLQERENGQGITEYAMAFAVIALGTVAGESAVAQQINHTFIALATTLTTGITQ